MPLTTQTDQITVRGIQYVYAEEKCRTVPVVPLLLKALEGKVA